MNTSSRWHSPPAIRVSRALLSAVAVLVNACGGGGGAPFAETNSASAGTAALANIQIPSYVASIYHLNTQVLDVLPQLRISARLAGDVGAIQGNFIQIVAEDKDGIVKSAEIVTTPGSSTVGIYITFAADILPPKRYTGPLRISACLDPACTQRLSGTPFNVPYDITVLRTIQVDFGSASSSPTIAGSANVPNEKIFPIFLPEGTVTYAHAIFEFFSAPGPLPLASVSLADPRQLSMQFPSLPAGEYAGVVDIRASGFSPMGRSMDRTEKYSITYIVR